MREQLFIFLSALAISAGTYLYFWIALKIDAESSLDLIQKPRLIGFSAGIFLIGIIYLTQNDISLLGIALLLNAVLIFSYAYIKKELNQDSKEYRPVIIYFVIISSILGLTTLFLS